MVRNRVLSFMSQFSKDPNRSPTPSSPTQASQPQMNREPTRQDMFRNDPSTPPAAQQQFAGDSSPLARPRVPGERVPSRPISMVSTYQAPVMEVNQNTLPELQPIFTYLNSHANKLYQEGYFLKLDDQNSHGRPNADRTWTECFAQLVGTILSLWDAAELDAAGQDGEVLPKFINLTDASIKMIEALPTRSNDDQPLQNVLSISTAGKNRYLLHFNSHHSLIQWTAGIRLAMFEHATLQEAYTGALIAGKGRQLNNINLIMERARFKTEDWVRVRFGAGTPWRRCWCVITPPDEKEYAKVQKELNKKKSAYDRTRAPVLKGDVKFYDNKKITKKTRPIATLSDAYSAFAIYPQSKPLIDASTLIKVEGTITIHTDPPTSTEGFVFVMPETHPAVSGFEIMLRWLFPALDTFALYGRPGRLIAETTNPQSLMFAMPTERRYGYLEILDVTSLILTEGSQVWRDREWRFKMKELTAKRMAAMGTSSRAGSRFSNGSRRNTRNSFGAAPPRPQFNDAASVKSTSSIKWGNQPSAPEVSFGGIPRTDSAPPAASKFQSPQRSGAGGVSHHRSISESHGLDRYPNQTNPGYDGGYDAGPAPPPHNVRPPAQRDAMALRQQQDMSPSPERTSYEDERAAGTSTPVRELQAMQSATRQEPVAMPPAFSHAAGTLPPTKPYHSPELRRGKNRLSTTTLSQMAGTAGFDPDSERPGTSGGPGGQEIGRYSEDGSQRGVQSDANASGMNANTNRLPEDLIAGRTNRLSYERSLPPVPGPSMSDVSSFPAPPNNQQYQNPALLHQVHVPSKLHDSQQSNLGGPPMPVGTSHSHSASDSSVHGPSSLSGKQGHGYTSSTESSRGLARLSTSSSQLKRKPLPHTNSATTIESPEAGSSITPSKVIDQAAFDQIVPRALPVPQDHDARDSFLDFYHSNESTASPDYASTPQSAEIRPSMEKPRAGVMRTVGTSEQPAPSNLISSDIPQFDFGPTINYASARLPLEPISVRAPQPSSSQNLASPDTALFPPRSSSRNNNSGPDSSQDPRYQPRSSSRNNMVSPEPQYRPDPSAVRTVAWQPGMAASGPIPQDRQVITPEQFVQQRAAAATPQYVQRPGSSNALHSGAPTPPIGRNQTGEYFAHSRKNSSELLQRPGSRGASTALAPAGSGDISANLSAREQEQVARATGQPLLNMQGGRTAAPSGGLVGTIDARGQERKAMMQGGGRGQAPYQGLPSPQFPGQFPPRGQSPGPNIPQGQFIQRGQSPGPNIPQGQFIQRGQSPGPNIPQGQFIQRGQSPGPSMPQGNFIQRSQPPALNIGNFIQRGQSPGPNGPQGQYPQYPPNQRPQGSGPPGGGAAPFAQGGGWSSPQRTPEQGPPGQYFPPQGRGMGPPPGRGQPYPNSQGRGQPSPGQQGRGAPMQGQQGRGQPYPGPQGRGQPPPGQQGRGQPYSGPQGRGQPPPGRSQQDYRGQGF